MGFYWDCIPGLFLDRDDVPLRDTLRRQRYQLLVLVLAADPLVTERPVLHIHPPFLRQLCSNLL